MLSDPTKNYLQQIDSIFHPGNEPDVPKIHVDYVASKVATLYEKLRQVIDYQEEHLLRKNTIERMLKRRLLLSSDPQEVAKPLVFELIRGGYFPNDEIPETKIAEITYLLAKYIFLREHIPAEAKDKKGLTDWLEALAASEIEEKLTPSRKEAAIVDYMVEEFLRRLVLPDVVIDDARKKEFVFIACQKALLKADEDLLSWRLLKYKFPEFAALQNQGYLMEFSQRLEALKTEVDWETNHPLIKRLQYKAYRLTPSFLLIQDVVLSDPRQAQEIFEKPESLELRIKFAYDKRFSALRRNNRRWGFRWVISILFSKMFLAFLIEVPYDRLTHNFSPLAAAVNLFVPPFLMFVIISSSRGPDKENKNQVSLDAMNIVYQSQTPEKIRIEKFSEKMGAAQVFWRVVFFVSSILVFGSVVYLLLKIHFSWLSIVIFLAFFSLIAFSGMKIEASSKQLIAKAKEDGFLDFLADIFFLPFRQVGKWLSRQLQRYNLLILILNLFFEAPLQIFFEFVESWRSFVKSKKEELE